MNSDEAGKHIKQMPETEDLTMYLAELAKIEVVSHTLYG